jgi:hypothetical protein
MCMVATARQGVAGRVRYGLWSAVEGGEETCVFGCVVLN